VCVFECKRKGCRPAYVCVCVRHIKNNSSSSASSSSGSILGSTFALSLSHSLSLSSPVSACPALSLSSPLTLREPHFLPFLPHTRHKSMFDFHNNSRREIRKAMQKKIKIKIKEKEKKAEGRLRETARTQDTGHYVRAMFKIFAFAVCFFFFLLFSFSFYFFALLFISCVTHFIVVVVAAMKFKRR